MALAQRQMTVEEFLALPFLPYTELIDGMVVVNAPVLRHQRLAFRLAWLLESWVQAHPGLGEVGMGGDVRINARNVVVPDVWFVTEARRPSVDAPIFTEAPDLVAEVRLPSTWRHDRGLKLVAYQLAGVQELWLLDTERDTVVVWRGEESFEVAAGEVLTTPLLPGLAVDVAGLFDR